MDFLGVDKLPRGDSHLLFELLLELGDGEVGYGGEVLQCQSLGDMVQNVSGCPANIRCKLEAYLFRGFQHQEQKQGDVLGSQLGIVAGGGDSEGLLEQIPGAFRVHADDAGGQTLKLLLQGGDGGAAQKQGALTGFQVQLKPEHFGDGNRNGVGAVYLMGLGDENISATENVGLAPYGKAGVSGAE